MTQLGDPGDRAGQSGPDAPPVADEIIRSDSVQAEAGTDTEMAIAAIWSRVLGLDAFAVGDDFFELGGNSLMATQVVVEIRQTLGAELDLAAIFETPTLSRLAAQVEVARHHGDSAPPPLVPYPRPLGTRLPLTQSQLWMWRLESAADPPGLYNITAEHCFDAPVEVDTLRWALAHVVERHEALRLSFGSGDGREPYQTVSPSVDVELDVVTVEAGSAEEGEAELRRMLAAQNAQPFDWGQPPLLRARLFRRGDAYLVAVTVDHLICDGTSAHILLRELAAAYESKARGRRPALRRLAVQYPDAALWQRAWLTEGRLEAQVAYWRRRLAGVRLGPAFPFDRIPRAPSRRIAAVDFSVAGDMYRSLRRVARSTASTVFVVSAAVVQALAAIAGRETDVVLSTTLSGRQRRELDGLIGCFHGAGRIRTDLSGDPPFETLVARTRESILGLLENQDVPFFRIRESALPAMPAGGPARLAAMPTEFQYSHTAHDELPRAAREVERPRAEAGPDQLFFRGHMHPLVISILDDGQELWGSFSYKVDFYDAETIEDHARAFERVIAAVTQRRGLRLSQLPVGAARTPRPGAPAAT